MKLDRLVPWFATFSVLVACSGDSHDPGDGDRSDMGQTATHRQEMRRCDDERSHAVAAATSPETIAAAFDGWSECLAVANDKAVVRMEGTLADNGSPLEGAAKQVVAGARGTAASLCHAMVDSQLDGEPDMVPAMIAGCLGERERVLGRLLDAYAELGQEPEVIAEDRETFAACYTAFDRDLAAAASQIDLTAAAFQLADCIADEVRGPRATALIERILSNFPASDPVEIERLTNEAIAAAIDADAAMCELAAEAGPDGGGSLARSSAGMCGATAASLLADHMGQFAPDPDDL
jgi:hypothetical protein